MLGTGRQAGTGDQSPQAPQAARLEAEDDEVAAGAENPVRLTQNRVTAIAD